MSHPNTLPYHLPADAVWFITGCSSGIGHALAQLLSKAGARVAATARKTEALSEIPSQDNVLKLQLDVTSTSSIDTAVQTTLEKFGRIDIVVNNAGYTLAGITEVSGDEESRAVLDTNFWGMVNVSKRALQIMREENAKTGQQGGVILNVSSMGGFTGYPGQAFYHASKFAMEGWTESVAKEVPSAWNIHLCNIEPGGVKTKYAGSSLKRVAKDHPAYADPSFPANQLIAHLANKEAHTHWAEPEALAAAIIQVVSLGKRIPIRIPLGADAWGMIGKDIEAVREDLDEFKDISLSVGDKKQMDSIRFLQK